ncbi:hypothetical protein H744_2c2985 [Photobacterium gaetbulicola Gung47]|uniref:Uncharacterized protein n=1 Tax=Photobacterium gaetbulicola Gung47 TaxID=658445 RepID=A0A0C5WD42_9GAMM|nr:hypothetical protein [Photobacterium gaetbulicola]AJR09636.1 hypothetical protein H744_2c2985 [Photobacterium gaetbulicola Gung47]
MSCYDPNTAASTGCAQERDHGHGLVNSVEDFFEPITHEEWSQQNGYVPDNAEVFASTYEPATTSAVMDFSDPFGEGGAFSEESDSSIQVVNDTPWFA